MNWLAGWDFPARTSPALPIVFAQLIFALFVTIVMVILRMAIDLVSPGAGALALLYPAVMIATLFGRWLCGLLTLAAATLYTIFFVMEPVGSFTLQNARDFPRLVVNISVLAVTIILLEIFRNAIAQANAERDRQIAQRELLLHELDHRVKNNFASVLSLLQMQQQRATDPVVRAELNSAAGRIESIATVHRFLYRTGTPDGDIDIGPYLAQLCSALGAALLQPDRVSIECDAESVRISRDRVIPIALIINELVTNAARHAFPNGRRGVVQVSFKRAGDGYELVVADNGVGMTGEPREGGIGRRLISAFVREAEAEIGTESSPKGTRCVVLLR